MRIFIWITLLSYLGMASLYAGDSLENKDLIDREITMLSDLIDATQQNLNNQIKLRDLIKQYQTYQKRYLEVADDNELLYQMIKTAYVILDIIKQNHLAEAFDPAFISELTIVSKPAAKRGLPKP